MRAIFALARATFWALLALVERSEMELNESKPTAITVSNIMRDKVTVSAKPFAPDGELCCEDAVVFMVIRIVS
jgi:hypothetical protein